MKYVLIIVIVLFVLAAGALLYAWSGIYNIAVTEQHWPVTKSFMKMVRDRSILARSDDIKPPEFNETMLNISVVKSIRPFQDTYEWS